MEGFPGTRNYVRTSAAALALFAAGCTGGGHTSSEATHTVAPSVEVDYCAQNGRHDVLQPFDDQNFQKQSTSSEIIAAEDEWYRKYPTAQPEELANVYIQSRKTELGINDISFVLDPSLHLTTWAPSTSESVDAEQRGQRVRLIRDLANIIDDVDEYPPGMLAALKVRTIRLADTHVDKNISGRYDVTQGEIQIEYNTKEEVRLSGDLRSTVAHEIGHGIHSQWCGGHDVDDKELAGSIKFIGRTFESMSEEEQNAAYGQVTHQQYVDGMSRVFPDAYSATNVQEYFASLLAFTIENRGLIMPGDKDYGSPLYHNQQLVVARTEKLFPGFETFVHKQTMLLRTDPANEVFTDLEKVIVTRSEVDRAVAGGDRKDPIVLNGMSFSKNYAKRGGTLDMYPRVSKDLQGLKIYVEEFSGGSRYVDLEQFDSANQIILLKMPDAAGLFSPLSQASKLYETYGLKPRQNVWAGDTQAAQFVQKLQSMGARFVIVEFTK